MGIRVADFMDIEDIEVHEGVGILALLEFASHDVSLDIEEELQQEIQKYKEQQKEYLKRREELFADSYEQMSLLIYQTDKRGLHTQEEFFAKVKELREATIKKRKEIEAECFPVNEAKEH